MAFSLIDTLTSTQEGYALALDADSVSPQLSYSLDGESVDRNAWRKHMLDMINELQERICKLQVYEIRSQIL